MASSRAVGVLALALVIVGAATVPRVLCGLRAPALFRGEQAALDDLARQVSQSARGADTAGFRTGSPRFDGEWALVTDQMTVLGLGQLVLLHPQRRAAYLPVIEHCVQRLLDPKTTAFGTDAWREQGLRAAESKNGHAYLGYVNLALGMLRLLDKGTRYASVHDRLTAALARRVQAAPYHFIETYPGEAYPADMAMVIGSIGLYDQATGADHRALIQDFAASLRALAMDPGSGLLHQRVQADSGRPAGPPRASGTALAIYALSFADRGLSRELYTALSGRQRAGLFGFGAVREYPPGQEGGGDIDSGPVLLGVSVSATGFALAGTRLFADEELFTALYRTADLFGVPVAGAYGRVYLIGGPLGNAILLSMISATWERGA